MQNIQSFYDLEQLVKKSVQNHIEDNREDIKEALEEYGEIDGFFYNDEMMEASQTLANDFVMYYSDTWQICNVARFDAPSGCDYFWDAESQVQGCHDGEDYLDKVMTSIAYMIVESLAMEFFSEFLLVEKLPFEVPTQKLFDAVEAL
tara:strand:- start:33 stop:473 length:441 start_codon:yes stop_codon:yes gene_type:complete